MDDEDFPFPFPPYEVQKDFMKKLYSVLENSEIGIFESPTGTGKSLSLICGSLKWLKDFQRKQKEELQKTLSEESNNAEDDWFGSFLQKQEKSYKVIDAKKEYETIVEYESRIKKLRDLSKGKNVSVPKSFQPSAKRVKVADEDEALSDNDFMVGENEEEEEDETEKEGKKHVLKIYYASRTHSQLAQFLGEVQRSPYREQITVTTLGSRANYCVNPTVSKLRNLSLINEQCTDLQRKKGSKKCKFIKNVSELEDNILSAVRDIEDLVQIGKQLHSCPYYATRRVIPDAELVLLPYNILLHKSTRDAYGINLKDNVLIIDEAHNLVEAVNNMYSAEISGMLIQQTFWQVDAYFNCYKTRFSRENVRFIKILLSVSESIINYLKTPSTSSSKMMSVYDFISDANVGNINMFELVNYLEHSLIGQKLHGFTASRVAKGLTPLDDQSKKAEPAKKSGTANFLAQIKERNTNIPKSIPEEPKEKNAQYKPSAIFSFTEFLKTLTFPSKDGRILVNKTGSIEKYSLKFLHLNPVSHFQEVVKEARSIVLAGGTMQPISEFTEQLFLPAGVPSEKISLFSCGHVIPPENLLALGLSSGPCGNKLDFTFKSRQLPETIKELGSILVNMSTAVRGGVVCFFPSYDYEEFIFSELSKCKVIQSIEKRYRVFREPKLSSDVDRVLSDYAKCIDSACSANGQSQKNGALLFSIVGGKMSEGINFSDNLGRCVIMVGLPYPNKFSLELQEKMAHLNKQNFSSGNKKAGDVYYNNLCMKAVNQSIGRAIRHKNDYACILLVDYRYNNDSVKNLLPGWISRSLSYHTKFGTAYVALRKFFAIKSNGQIQNSL